MQIDAFLYINGIEVVNKIKKDKGFYFFLKTLWNEINEIKQNHQQQKNNNSSKNLDSRQKSVQKQFD